MSTLEIMIKKRVRELQKPEDSPYRGKHAYMYGWKKWKGVKWFDEPIFAKSKLAAKKELVECHNHSKKLLVIKQID
ncbi:MAG: hypothetical protein NT129_02225 [Candidatus Aenigmarchaeota archaeon]|nr:hypothetical protein [Candidatus Aenigmarchaeota archaeon]